MTHAEPAGFEAGSRGFSSPNPHESLSIAAGRRRGGRDEVRSERQPVARVGKPGRRRVRLRMRIDGAEGRRVRGSANGIELDQSLSEHGQLREGRAAPGDASRRDVAGQERHRFQELERRDRHGRARQRRLAGHRGTGRKARTQPGAGTRLAVSAVRRQVVDGQPPADDARCEPGRAVRRDAQGRGLRRRFGTRRHLQDVRDRRLEHDRQQLRRCPCRAVANRSQDTQGVVRAPFGLGRASSPCDRNRIALSAGPPNFPFIS